MSTQTYNAATVFTWQKLIALLTQIGSFFTTLWFVQWMWAEGALGAQLVLALIGETTLIVLKEQLFRGKSAEAGWAGLAVDTVINAGGILPKACRVLAFPPLAMLQVAVGSDPAACTTLSAGALGVALILGAALSFLPHRLWRS